MMSNWKITKFKKVNVAFHNKYPITSREREPEVEKLGWYGNFGISIILGSEYGADSLKRFLNSDWTSERM